MRPISTGCDSKEPHSRNRSIIRKNKGTTRTGSLDGELAERPGSLVVGSENGKTGAATNNKSNNDSIWPSIPSLSLLFSPPEKPLASLAAAVARQQHTHPHMHISAATSTQVVKVPCKAWMGSKNEVSFL